MTRERERGSVLLLVPAGVLIVLVLAAIAVDLSIVQLRKRQAVDLAAAAANDAATAGAHADHLRRGGYVLSEDRTADVVATVISASEHAGVAVWSHETTPSGVTVTVSLPADYIFARVIPGAPDGTTVTGRASATAPAG